MYTNIMSKKKYLISLLFAMAGLASRAQFNVPSGERIFVAAADELHVQENLENSGTIDRITLSGSAAQSISGTGSIFHLKVNKTTNPATISSGTQSIFSTLDLTAGTLTVGGSGNLRLKSLSTGTARILEHTTAGTLTGTVQVERYIDVNNRKKQWRLLGFPYSSATVLNNISGIGIDFTASTRSMMYFNESADNGTYGTGGTRNTGYNSFTAGTESITAKTGVAAWLYGASGTASTGTMSDSLTILSSGTLLEDGNPVSLPVNYTTANSNKGWNLVANPYASTIDWMSPGIVKSNIAVIYRYDPQLTRWTTHNGTSGTNSADQYIESGAGFFVQATGASPVLTIPQSAKTGSATAFTHFTRAPRLNIQPGERTPGGIALSGIRLTAKGAADVAGDEVYVDLSRSDASAGFDPQYDAESMGRTAGTGLAVGMDNGKGYAMQFDRPIVETGTEKRFFPLIVTAQVKGSTSLSLQTEGKWNPLNSVALIDTKEGKTLLMKGGQLSHDFTLDALKSEGRFILAINHVKLSSDGQSPAFDVKALGNPVTTSIIDLMITHPTASAKRWRVVDAMGRETGAGAFASDAGIQHRLTVPGMRNPGAYVVQIEMDNGETQQVRIVKQ